jgi:hypothetical protein
VKAFFDREVRRSHYVQERKQFRTKERAKWEQQLQEAAAVRTTHFVPKHHFNL